MIFDVIHYLLLFKTNEFMDHFVLSKLFRHKKLPQFFPSIYNANDMHQENVFLLMSGDIAIYIKKNLC